MDNINDLENSSKEQLVEKVESMQEEIDSLKEENSIQTKIISSIKDTLNERSVYK